MDQQLYYKITQNKLSLQELMDALHHIYPESMLQPTFNHPSKGILAIAEFVYNYAKDFHPYLTVTESIPPSNTQEINLNFEASWLNKEYFAQAYQYYCTTYHDSNWRFVIGAIDLLHKPIN